MSTETKSFECCCSGLKYWDLYPIHRTKYAGKREILEKKMPFKKISLKNERNPGMQSEALYMYSCSSAVYSGGGWAGREDLTTGELQN